jgi:hypothetical protein
MHCTRQAWLLATDIKRFGCRHARPEKKACSASTRNIANGFANARFAAPSENASIKQQCYAATLKLLQGRKGGFRKPASAGLFSILLAAK